MRNALRALSADSTSRISVVSVISSHSESAERPVWREDARHFGRERRFGELTGREVHAHRQPGPVARGVVPQLRLATRFLERPRTERNDEARLLGERDELRWRDQPAFGMLPADERFEPGERATRDVEHRLVVHTQLAALDGAVQRAAGAEVVDHTVMRRDVEHLGAVAAVFLRAVHRGVGVAQERLGSVAMPVGHRDPDRDGDEHFAFDEGNRFGDHFRDAFGDVLDGVQRW